MSRRTKPRRNYRKNLYIKDNFTETRVPIDEDYFIEKIQKKLRYEQYFVEDEFIDKTIREYFTEILSYCATYAQKVNIEDFIVASFFSLKTIKKNANSILDYPMVNNQLVISFNRANMFRADIIAPNPKDYYFFLKKEYVKKFKRTFGKDRIKPYIYLNKKRSREIPTR
jgi:hypothetical protein